eukprot:306530-Pelagomonas_calceolata.AAC.1
MTSSKLMIPSQGASCGDICTTVHEASSGGLLFPDSGPLNSPLLLALRFIVSYKFSPPCAGMYQHQAYQPNSVAAVPFFFRSVFFVKVLKA